MSNTLKTHAHVHLTRKKYKNLSLVNQATYTCT